MLDKNEVMVTRKELLQELEQIPDSALPEVLEFVRTLKTKHEPRLQQSDAWKAYLISKQKREEVYRRLAES